MTLRPNLFIAGFQKCGSSALFDLLTQHPHIHGSNPKETYYLSDPSYENYNFEKSVLNPYTNWEPFFKGANNHAYYLEGSVCNFYQETAIQYFENHPDCKVLFILRDPVERFVSNFKYYGTSGLNVKPGITIEEYYLLIKKDQINKEPIRLALSHGHYAHYIDEIRKRCGNHRIYCIGLVPLVKQPKEEINKLLEFLGLDLYEKLKLQKKNKSTNARFPRLNAFLLKTFGGKGIGNTQLGQLYRKSNKSQKAPDVTLPKWIKEELEERYRLEYQRFSHLF
jgi:hypothetical protein